MSSKVEPSLFDFVNDFSDRVRQGSPTQNELIDPSDPIITFCESFYEQFFANVVGVQIFGLDLGSKAIAAKVAVRLESETDQSDVRSLVALFERLCDTFEDIQGDYGGSSVAYGDFARNVLSRLLQRSERWAKKADTEAALAARIAIARTRFDAALAEMKW